jgi:3-oxoacyl-[acyl-carrier protein] reductase
MNLKGATALVTGGSNGIGLAIARTLTEAGAKVAITGRDEKRLAAAGKAIGARTIHADVAKEADVLRTYQELFREFGHLDILVNNAGFGVIKPLVEMDLAGFEQVFGTNVTGAMLMAREAAKHFIERKRGNIINIGSTAAVRGAAKGTVAHAVKAALEMDDRGFTTELTVFATNPKD